MSIPDNVINFPRSQFFNEKRLEPMDPKKSKHEPVMFQKQVCDEFDGYINLIVHVIKQAVDDYARPRITKIKNVKDLKAIRKKADDAREFLYGPDGLEELLRVSGLENHLDVSYVRRKAESNDTRHYYFVKRRGPYESL